MKPTFPRFQPLLSVILAGLIIGLASPTVCAQSTGVKSKPLISTTLSGDDTKESIMLSVEFAPGGTTGLHTHPGDEYTFVLQGTLELTAEGREPRRVSAGDVYHNPRGLIHQARNVGEIPALVNITFIVDKGKPRTEPVIK